VTIHLDDVTGIVSAQTRREQVSAAQCGDALEPFPLAIAEQRLKDWRGAGTRRTRQADETFCEITRDGVPFQINDTSV
jgi:hypothetical protein